MNELTDVNMDSIKLELARRWVDRQNWRWAKTYAKFAPHWYVVMDKLPENEKIEMRKVMETIQRNGVPFKFGINWYTVLVIDGYRYWSTGSYEKGKFIINRAKHDKPQELNPETESDIRTLSRFVDGIEDWEMYWSGDDRCWRANDPLKQSDLKDVKALFDKHGREESFAGYKLRFFCYEGYKYWFWPVDLIDHELTLNRK